MTLICVKTKKIKTISNCNAFINNVMLVVINYKYRRLYLVDSKTFIGHFKISSVLVATKGDMTKEIQKY